MAYCSPLALTAAQLFASACENRLGLLPLFDDKIEWGHKDSIAYECFHGKRAESMHTQGIAPPPPPSPPCVLPYVPVA